MRKQFELSINHPMLKGARQAFDTCLKIAICKAIKTESMEGSAHLKVSFEIQKGTDKDTGEIYMMPVIKFKTGYSVPMKDGIDGDVIEVSRLIPDQDGEYLMVNEQVSMDELMEGAE